LCSTTARLRRLTGRLRIIKTSRPPTLPFTPAPAYRYAQNIPFPGSRITLCSHRGIRSTPARSMRLAVRPPSYAVPV
jgi:hypothetical protein